MASKELAKKHEKEKEAAISPFVVFQTPVSEIRDAVLANLGDNGVSAQDFERVKIPAELVKVSQVLESVEKVF